MSDQPAARPRNLGQAVDETRETLMEELDRWTDLKVKVAEPMFGGFLISPDDLVKAKERVAVALDAYVDARITIGVYSGARTFDVPEDGNANPRVHPSRCWRCKHITHGTEQCSFHPEPGMQCDCVG